MRRSPAALAADYGPWVSNVALCAAFFFPHLQPFSGSGGSCMMMERETDEYELALRACAGDREALAELVDRTRLRLFQAVTRPLRGTMRP